MYTAVQSQKAVTAYFSSKQLLPFGFAEQYSTYHWNCSEYLVYMAIWFCTAIVTSDIVILVRSLFKLYCIPTVVYMLYA